MFGTLLLVACAFVLALYVTFRFVRRFRDGDRGLKSFGVWMRDLMDVAFGFG